MKFLSVLFLVLSLSAEYNKPNFEQIALEYFSERIESEDVFRKSCDCKPKYNLDLALLIYDSSCFELLDHMNIVFMNWNIDWQDSLIWSGMETESIGINLLKDNERIRSTTIKENFSENHYLIRFSERVYFDGLTYLEMNLKDKKECSGMNYIFQMNETGQVLKFKAQPMCDYHW